MTDTLKKLIEDELESAYEQGIAEGKRINDKGCEGCKYLGLDDSFYPCNCCMNNYRNLWEPKKKDDEFDFGDEVVDEHGEKGIVVSKDNTDRDNLWVLFSIYDVPQSVIKRDYKKTGKHYVLEKFMEELNG